MTNVCPPSSVTLTLLTLAAAATLAGCASGGPGKPPPPGDDDPVEDAAAPGGTGGKGGTGGSASPDARGMTPPPSDDAGAQGGSGGSAPPDAATGDGPRAEAGRDSQSGAGDVPAAVGNFSFFVTSMASMRELANSELGFGGDLRFGEMTGLAGADKICRTIAEKGVPGAGQKTWRAFLSTAAGGANGGPVHAIDRIGEGPWYDKMGRLFSMNKAGLLAGPRPMGHAQVVADFPNEHGVPNKMGVDNHDILTGSNPQGRYPGDGVGTTCNDWTSAAASGRPLIGHSWPRSPNNLSFGGHWISDHRAPGCAPGYNLSNSGGMSGGGRATVGGSGGYGGIYCFALSN